MQALCMVGRLPRVNPALSVTSSILFVISYSSYSVPVDSPESTGYEPK